jgi:hypothetical protein
MRARMIGVAVVVALALAGCGTDRPGNVSGDTTSMPGMTMPSGMVMPDMSIPSSQIDTSPEVPPTLTEALAKLPVKGRAPKTGYDRSEFGPAWTDDNGAPLGHNGCDTRNDMLKRDLDEETLKPDTHDCVVLTGKLADPYTGKKIDFTRGQDTSGAVQIDHVVALSDAWQKGAQQITPDDRVDLANDPLNLQSTDGPTNGAKGDGDAATWLPSSKEYRCTYVARQVAVKSKYHLWVTQAEYDAIAGVLATCPGQPLPA